MMEVESAAAQMERSRKLNAPESASNEGTVAIGADWQADIGGPSNENAQRNRFDGWSWKTNLMCALVLLVGAAASAAFMAIGIDGSNQIQDDLFDRHAAEIAGSIETSWQSYEVAGLYVHEAGRSRNVSRKEFRELYEYLISTGLVFQVTSYNANITNAERPALEEESRQFYGANYPDLVPDYQGITGLEPIDPSNSSAGMAIGPRSVQPFYFPVHLLEPIEGNVGAIDFDLYSSASRRETIHLALDTWKPALTPRLRLVQETDPNAYSVILMHPGVPLSTIPNLRPRDFSSVVIRIPDLIRASIKGATPTIVYIFDSTDGTAPPVFLGGATLGNDGNLVFEKETTLEEVSKRPTEVQEIDVNIASSKWTIAIVAREGTYVSDYTFIVLGGVIIFTACVILAVWLMTAMRQQRVQARAQQKAEAEKAALIVEAARKAARNQRELNDFISHEVRNPLSAALSACTFVTTAVTEEVRPLMDGSKSKKNLESALEDCNIISSSLQFINDLLRNMLDMQRASTNQLTIEVKSTDLRNDVIMPVDAMLYRRGSCVEVQSECPDNLVVMADRLRLKQVVLNLARNSIKFVEVGYIRVRATVIDNKVHIFIEDSGPGIPDGKHQQLFAKFQDSCDSLKQGTGIGLSLCQHLIDLMGADIWYDESFHSGIEGCPGTRFVINLNIPPLKLDDDDFRLVRDSQFPGLSRNGDFAKITDTVSVVKNANDVIYVHSSAVPSSLEVTGAVDGLPAKLTILFVDDDLVLRKLFCRAVRRVAPGWVIHEASNGESALRLFDDSSQDMQRFDIIFLDQYMASIEKQLLGTETVMAIRAKGVRSTICGLSANDNRQTFLNAGANAFMMKPFPCEKVALANELMRVIRSGDTFAIAESAV
ncbi:phosphorelay sensor kinase [Fragilaria crotonensis]|nr:phosphorelay sensor kinase [Fragilaria crotonensis]